jgi:catechol 2,3-dioxygenase-like lactoylglutathione lyase family enzyme
MTRPAVITGIDHPVIAVRDMETGRAAYERLGFTVTPRGSHAEWGTGNWCIMFPSDYVELRGIIDPQSTHNLADFLRDGEGLMGIALGTEDAQASYDALAARGLKPRPVQQLTRTFELPEGAVQPRFSLCFLDAADTPGLMSVVFCQHLTPELLRRPEWLEHENGALGVVKMTGVVRDLSAAVAAHGKLFGPEAVREQADRIAIQLTDRQSIELLTPAAADKAFAGVDLPMRDGPGSLCSVTLRVSNIGATSDFLTSRDIEFRTTADRTIRLHRRAACGVLLEFTE